MMNKTISLVLVLSLGLAAEVANADFIFGKPTNLGPTVNSPAYDERPSISADGLTLYFNSNKSGGYGDFDLWMTTRSTKNSPWGQPENLGSTVNTSAREQTPWISADGLSLYFNSTRPGGYGPALWGDIWVTTRATTSDPWGAPVNLGPIVNLPSHAYGPSISYDGLSLFFGSNLVGGYGGDDIWVTTRTTTDDGWGTPKNLGPMVNSSAHEGAPSISADGLVLFFSGYALGPYRSGGYGNADLWMTTRPNISDLWSRPVNLGPEVNTSSYDFFPSISADGSTIFFMSDRSGGYGNWDLWQVPILPIVDLNNDRIVDAADLTIMVEHWGTDESLCDIGPMPWGDGIVDVQDLIVLSEHLFTYPGALAYWKLDEIDGNIAYDSVGNYDGTIMGGPFWQPDGGVVAGALQFDGQDDYFSTTPVLNPADGLFSVFAWIKGGAPGQVVISQTVGGVNWLLVDPTEGNLMTELKGTGRSGKPLQSQTNITDGNWHHIGFVWDGSNRTLYVDGVTVAEDAQDGLEGSEGGLYFGTGKVMETGTYWSGLIDDVLIYNRAIRP
ncbi:MAG: LamG-like jellyroll fold domain-containing protein [Planctomycetota bacterium]|jgi:hypothetical protein